MQDVDNDNERTTFSFDLLCVCVCACVTFTEKGALFRGALKSAFMGGPESMSL